MHCTNIKNTRKLQVEIYVLVPCRKPESTGHGFLRGNCWGGGLFGGAEVGKGGGSSAKIYSHICRGLYKKNHKQSLLPVSSTQMWQRRTTQLF